MLKLVPFLLDRTLSLIRENDLTKNVRILGVCLIHKLCILILLCGRIIEIFVRNLNDEPVYYSATDEYARK